MFFNLMQQALKRLKSSLIDYNGNINIKLLIVILFMIAIIFQGFSSITTGLFHSSHKTETTEVVGPIIATSGAKTVTISANGEYAEGTEINSGIYYVMLTEFSASDDTDEVYISIYENKKKMKSWDSLYHVSLKVVGVTEKVSVPKNSVVSISGGDTKYKLTFYTEEDYKQLESTKPTGESSSSTTQSSTSSTTSSSSTSPSTSSTTSSSSTSPSTSSSSSSSSSSVPDLNQYATYLQNTINNFVDGYQVTVTQKEGGVLHIVFPQDIKYDPTSHLQEFADAMLEVHRSAFYLWVDENNIDTANGGTEIPIFYMDAEDGTRIAEYSVLSDKMKVKIKN